MEESNSDLLAGMQDDTENGDDGDFLKEMMEYEAQRRKDDGAEEAESELQYDDDDFIKQMQEYEALEKEREEESRKREEEY